MLIIKYDTYRPGRRIPELGQFFPLEDNNKQIIILIKKWGCNYPGAA